MVKFNRTVSSAFGIILLGFGVGCSEPPLLQGFNEAAAHRVASAVDAGRLGQRLDRVSASHAMDTPIDCRSLDSTDDLPCHLTHLATRELIQREFAAQNLRTRKQTQEQAGLPVSNLIAELPGVGKSDEIVLLGAHYDAYFSGADDNSTGTAALLELAQVLSGFTFRRTIRLVAFDLEELGYFGSSQYVASESLENHQVVLILDSLGNRNTAQNSQPAQFGLP